MKSILEELFYGNICPNEDSWSCTKEVKELSEYIADQHNDLRSTLTDKQKESLDKLNDCQNELGDIAERALFSYAFRLGMRIAIEVLYPVED